MSYSFSVQATTKAEAKEKIAKEWDNVVGQQPIHLVDRSAAQAVAEAFVDALSAPDSMQQISVNCYGSVSYRDNNTVTTVSGTVSAGLGLKT